MRQRKTFVFVYGTLKQGQLNHRLVSDLPFRGVVETMEPARLFDTGMGYPALTLDPDGEAVVGELYEVPAERETEVLGRLDMLEGCPHLYRRQRLRVTDGEATWRVWAYVYALSTMGLRQVGRQWQPTCR